MNSSIDAHQEYLPLPIDSAGFAFAKRFAAAQPHASQGERIYLNTLAVWVVNNYLQLLQIDTELEKGDSWNPVLHMCEDVADLAVKGLGKLECRPVRITLDNLPNSCPVPLEAREARLGYVVVGIDEEAKRALLLGFSPTAEEGTLVINQLKPLDSLLRHLQSLGKSAVSLNQWLVNSFNSEWQDVEAILTPTPKPKNLKSPPTSTVVNVGNWFKNIFSNGWQTLEARLNTPQPSRQFRGSIKAPSPLNSTFRKAAQINPQFLPKADVKRAKLIDLGVQLDDRAATLLVGVTHESEQRISIIVQLHPASGDRYLYPQMKLILLSETEEILQEVVSRGQDLYIQLRLFYVSPVTIFKIQVALDDVCVCESFSFQELG